MTRAKSWVEFWLLSFYCKILSNKSIAILVHWQWERRQLFQVLWKHLQHLLPSRQPTWQLATIDRFAASIKRQFDGNTLLIDAIIIIYETVNGRMKNTWLTLWSGADILKVDNNLSTKWNYMAERWKLEMGKEPPIAKIYQAPGKRFAFEER